MVRWTRKEEGGEEGGRTIETPPVVSVKPASARSDLVCAGDKSDGGHVPYPCPSCVSGRTLRSSSVSSAESGAAATTQQRTLERSYVFVRRCWWWGIRVSTAVTVAQLVFHATRCGGEGGHAYLAEQDRLWRHYATP